MAYATTGELAEALRIAETVQNVETLRACLDAAALEIDAVLEDAPLLDPNPLLNRVNVLRGVEWWKANDAAFGAPAGGGAPLLVPPSSFAKLSATLTPLKTTFGVA
jgi:hypothetical protein